MIKFSLFKKSRNVPFFACLHNYERQCNKNYDNYMVQGLHSKIPDSPMRTALVKGKKKKILTCTTVSLEF